MALSQETINCYLSTLKNKGEVGLYRKIVGSGIINSLEIQHPDVEILNLSENFFCLFRRTGEHEHFLIGKVLRRAAHAIYRQLLRLNKIEVNARFLNIVRK
jgi:hypothetical protein